MPEGGDTRSPPGTTISNHTELPTAPKHILLRDFSLPSPESQPMGHHQTPWGDHGSPQGSDSRELPALGAARSSIAPRTSQVTSKKGLCTRDLWAPRKLAVHLASPSKADGAALARRLVLGASSPRTALPLPATLCRERASSRSLGKEHGKVVAVPRWQGCCITFFFPHRAAQLLPPAYYTLHRCHGHASAPTDFTLREAEQQPWLWVSFTLRWAGQPCHFQTPEPSSPRKARR